MASIMDLFNPEALRNLLAPVQSQGNFLTRPDLPALPSSNIAAAPQVAAYQEPAPVQQAMAQAAPQMAPQQARSPMGGLGDFFTPDRKASLNDFFTGLALGDDWQSGIALGAANVNQNKASRQQRNQTVDFLKGKGLSDQEASQIAGNPAVLSDYLKNLNRPNDPQAALQLEKTQLEINKLRQGRPEVYNTLSADEKTQLGLDPGKAYQRGADNKISEIGGNGVNVNVEAPKLPSGYRFADPKNPNAGVEPIPGGPATQLPGELAARVGMADNFLNNDLPAIRESVKQGDVTGPIDRFSAANRSSGKPAETYRKIQSGVEVLSRLLSGAGMTQVEIDEKTRRYMPTYTDDAASVATKLDQLEAELKATKDAALRGRGGPTQGQPPAGGVIDYKTYFGGQ